MITDPFSDGGFSKKVNKSELLYFYFQIGYLRYKRTKETSSGKYLNIMETNHKVNIPVVKKIFFIGFEVVIFSVIFSIIILALKAFKHSSSTMLLFPVG